METLRILFATFSIATLISCNSVDRQPHSIDSIKVEKAPTNLAEPNPKTDTLPAGIKQYALIVDIRKRNDTSIIDADYIQYLFGQAAIDAAIKAHQADTFKTADGKIHIDFPNDNFIVNENKKIRTLILAKNCFFDLIINPDGIPPITDNSVQSLLKVCRGYPFILTLNDDNVVLGIKQVFVP